MNRPAGQTGEMPHACPEGADAPALARWLRAGLMAGADLTVDSRRVRPGDGFLAYPGERADGRAFIEQAIDRGARAVLWDDAEGYRWPSERGFAQRPVEGLRARAGAIAAGFYEDPSHHLDLIAVTGTNGKTSCTHWIAQGLALAGRHSALIGTLGSGPIDALDPFGLTTPDAVSLQRMLARFVAQKMRAVAIEASSIGLHQGRLDGARIEAAVFTNLTHDHLDYHGDLARYAEAKAMLFARPELKLAVFNGDDPASSLMLSRLDRTPRPDAQRPVWRLGYGLSSATSASARRIRVDAWLLAEQVEASSEGMRARLVGDFGSASVHLPLIGQFNLSNALAAAATWIGLGVSFDDAIDALSRLTPVAGRLQSVPVDPQWQDGPRVLVDYAHTPDALINVLKALRPIAAARGGRLWCVFGAGGDRDPAKRPLMAQAVESLADEVVITSDNPRKESPVRIIADLRAGLTREPRLTDSDRARAIGHAVRSADARDVVLIAGKGHEAYQQIGDDKLPFSDLEQARAALMHRERVDHV